MDAVRSVERHGMKMCWATKTMRSVVLVLAAALHANHHSLKLFGLLGAVFFAAQPASGQCTDQWLPGNGLPGLNGTARAALIYDDGTGPPSGELS